MIKAVKLFLFDGKARGFRPIVLHYKVNPVGSDRLYQIIKAIRKDGTELDLDNLMSWYSNEELDERIARANAEMVEFAKKELGVNLEKPKRRAVRRPKVKDDEDSTELMNL